MGHMIHMGDKRCAYKILVDYSERKTHLKDSGVDGLLLKIVFAETENMCSSLEFVRWLRQLMGSCETCHSIEGRTFLD